MTAGIFLVLARVLNSRVGRDLEELAAERLQLLWHRIRVHVFVALFDLVMDFFKHVLEGLERVLYEVDEWLRFKSGETELTLRVKAVLGLPWAIVRFVVGFLVTVLVEPQINPIKHFPVVTVSHKVILPMQPMLASPLDPVFGKVLANTIAGVTVLLLPGVVGFLVWELRGNWRLYAVNRHRELQTGDRRQPRRDAGAADEVGHSLGHDAAIVCPLAARRPTGQSHATPPRTDGLLREAASSRTRRAGASSSASSSGFSPSRRRLKASR